jgi:hypothetical protein
MSVEDDEAKIYTNGDLVIELINLEKNQQVEVLIDTNGTIYKVES